MESLPKASTEGSPTVAAATAVRTPKRRAGPNPLEALARAATEPKGDGEAPAAKKARRPLGAVPQMLRDVEEREVRWVWRRWLPAGHLTLWVGEPKVGKGISLASIAAKISKGEALPGQETVEPGAVMWAECEDDLNDTLRPRLIANDADAGKVVVFGPGQFPIEGMSALIEKWKVKLIVLSSLKDYLEFEGVKVNPNNDMEVRAALYRLRSMVEGTGCALVGIGHPNKNFDNPNALDRISGSGAFAQVARNIIGVRYANPEDEDGPRLVQRIGGNIGRYPPALQVEFEHAGKDPDDSYVRAKWSVAPAGASGGRTFFAPPLEKRETAAEWLKRFLKEKGEALKEEVVIPAAKAAGHTRAAIEKAFDRGGGRELKWRKEDQMGGRVLWRWEPQALV